MFIFGSLIACAIGLHFETYNEAIRKVDPTDRGGAYQWLGVMAKKEWTQESSASKSVTCAHFGETTICAHGSYELKSMRQRCWSVYAEYFLFAPKGACSIAAIILNQDRFPSDGAKRTQAPEEPRCLEPSSQPDKFGLFEFATPADFVAPVFIIGLFCLLVWLHCQEHTRPRVVISSAALDSTLCGYCGCEQELFALMPCGHAAACSQCVDSHQKCPACRKVVTGSMLIQFT